MIKKRPEMLKWVEENSLLPKSNENFIEHIYSAVNQYDFICPEGNKKRLKNWKDGVIGCSPTVKECNCARNKLAEGISKTKLNYSQEEKDKIHNKRIETMVGRYGVPYNSQREDIKHIICKSKLSDEKFNKLNDYDWLDEEYNNKLRTGVDIGKELNVDYSTVLWYCKKHGFKIRQRGGYSMTEIDIQNYIKSLGFDCQQSNWDILNKKEIDLFIPSKNIAIEIDGLYWHGFNPNDKELIKSENPNRHLDKTIECENKGIQILHITDWEWNNKQDIIKSILSSKFGITNKIFARKCIIKKIQTHTAKDFFDINHLQGHINAGNYYGLFYNNELVQCISLGKNRFDKNENYKELYRMCSKLNLTVVGGFSKLIKFAKNDLQCNIITYCDRSKSNGNGYLNSGFKFIKYTEPGFFWTDGDIIYSRFKCQRKPLKKWLVNFDESLSVSENMFNNGYRRFYDCGNLVFSYEK